MSIQKFFAAVCSLSLLFTTFACKSPAASDAGVVNAGRVDAGSADAGPQDSIAYAALATEISQAYCATFFRCGISGLLGAFIPQWVTNCEENIRAQIQYSLDAQFDSFIKNGTVKYDGVKAKQQVEDFENIACDAVYAAGSNLFFGLTGTVSEGGACVDAAECAVRSTCEGTDGGCGGFCRAYIELPVGSAADCDDTRYLCAAGSFCKRDTNTCEAIKQKGEACAKFGDQCAGLMVCAPGTSPDGGNSCVIAAEIAKKEGDPCSRLDECEWPLQCRFAGAMAEGETCVKRLAPGAPCSPKNVNYCAINERCVPDEIDPLIGNCGPLAKLGEACGYDGCGEGLTCKNQKCESSKRFGEACTRNDECEQNNCQNGVCEDPNLCRYP